ncbi:MAG: hypothetical protein IPH53_22280 [Flavobacteriales bacterium]|nr:hypothetical protein [Flavobacteriales bacterium]
MLLFEAHHHDSNRLSALGQGPEEVKAPTMPPLNRMGFLRCLRLLGPPFTAILTVATLLMRWDMVRTMRETKKSADAYVMSESGRMMVLDVLINKGYDRVAMAYQNVGRGPVKVLLFSIEYDAIPADVKPELAKSTHTQSLIEAPVLSSEIFATAISDHTPEPRGWLKWTVTPNVIEKVKSPYNRFWFQSILGYETGKGEYRTAPFGVLLGAQRRPSMYPFAPYSEGRFGIPSCLRY